jgi:hypothetical protein
MTQADEPDDGAQFEMVVPMVMQNQKEIIDRHNMALMEFRQSVDRLLDGLTADQCHTLYRLMINIGENGIPISQFVAGQLSTMLRLIHKICSSCGSTQHDTDQHMFLNLDDQEEIELLKNPPKPESEIPDNKLEPEALMAKYRVNRVGPCFRCNDCNAVYPTVEHRIRQGIRCPSCLLKEQFGE